MESHELLISRDITISGPHYDTVCEVEGVSFDHHDVVGVTIRQTYAEGNEEGAAADADRGEDVLVFSWSEWAAIEDHVSTVQAVYGNPDRGTEAYTQDQLEAELPEWAQELVQWQRDHPGEAYTLAKWLPDGARCMVGGQCGAQSDEGPCWLADGHGTITWGERREPVAGHITASGHLFKLPASPRMSV